MSFEITDNILKFNDNVAVIDDKGNSYLYRDLFGISQNFISSLRGQSKNVVLIKTSNSVESLAGYLGCICSNNMAVLIDHSVNNSLFDNVLQCYQPEYIWQPKTNGKCERIFSFGNYELVPTKFNFMVDIYSELNLVLLTSGSTGSPKGVRLTKNNLSANACSIVKYLGLDKNERPVTNLPMSYSYGLSVINSHLSVGATILLTNLTIVQKEFWNFSRNIKRHLLQGSHIHMRC